MSPAKKALVPNGRRLAEFMPLRKAEEELRRACREGDPAVIGDGTRPETAPNASDCIRAAVLRVFCLGLDPDAPMHEHGIHLLGAWIDGDLDLTGCDLPRRIMVVNSVLDGNVELLGASAKQLIFDGSRCKAISADRLRSEGGVFLRNGFVAERTVRLLGAAIGGNFVCAGGHFEANEGYALAFDRAEIAGSVFMSDGFVATRNVRFLGATIGGDLECLGGHFEANEGYSLSFDGAEIAGSVFMSDGFLARGAVRLLGATIGNDLACRNGRFETSEGYALSFDRAKISGSVLLTDGFLAKNTVSLAGAAIGANLECRNGTFEGDTSLILERAAITGLLFLDAGFRASGVINLMALTVDCLVDDELAWTPGYFVLDGFTYRRFTGNAPVDAAARVRWLDRQPYYHITHDFRPHPWEECARALAEMGHELAASLIRIEKRRRMRWLPWWRATSVLSRFATLPRIVFDWVLDKTVGYGWAPRRPLYWLFALWISASYGYDTLPPGVMAPTDALVYFSPRIPDECKTDWTSLVPRNVMPTEERRQNAADELALVRRKEGKIVFIPEWKEICTRAMPSEYSTFSPFAYALDVLLPIVDLRQENDWSPRVTDAAGDVIAPLWKDATWGWGYVARWLEWLLILLGWALSGLLLGAVTGVIRRD